MTDAGFMADEARGARHQGPSWAVADQPGGADPRTIAILGGTGAMGRGLAQRWALAGYDVVIGSREAARAAAAAGALRPPVRGEANPAAVAAADIVVLAVPSAAHDPILQELAPWFRPGTVLLDIVVPLRWDAAGGPLPAAGPAAAEVARSLLPPEIAVAAGFQSVSAASMADLRRSVAADILVCGEAAAKAVVLPLVEAIPGARYVDAGDLQTARALEATTALMIRVGQQYRSRRINLRIGGLAESRPARVGRTVHRSAPEPALFGPPAGETFGHPGRSKAAVALGARH